ncbi:MAG TPA: putative Na+/H+ antiporter, partial [Opitutaceae bacterium]|nr:putative Na+/H+ antiporter [Opitutaceae bacterium]
MLNLKLARGHAGWLALVWVPEAFAAEKVDMASFPKPLTDYVATDQAGVWATLQSRISVDPFNLVATTIFLLAIVHTFFTAKFRHWAHEVEEEHKKKLEARCGDQGGGEEDEAAEVSFQGQLLHFLGEIEAVFGIWAVVLAIAITFFKGWGTTVSYLGHTVNFTEAAFVTVIMALASTRPVLRFAEQCLSGIAKIGQSTAAAWWLTILIVAPLLGSFVTEPAAMTIAALLLGQQFYVHRPSSRFRYATLGLLFVNISVGGTLTHFAAPPVLMVAAPWGWNIAYMFNHFGWKAAVGIVAATLSYYTMFRGEFVQIDAARSKRATELETKQPIPIWITLTHLGFMGFTVFVAHYQALFIGGFLFFLAFHQATAHHQGKIELKSPLLVGFFLAGLVVHGGVQGWWI